MTIRWEGIILPIGIPSTDGRIVAPSAAITWRFPIPVYAPRRVGGIGQIGICDGVRGVRHGRDDTDYLYYIGMVEFDVPPEVEFLDEPGPWYPEAALWTNHDAGTEWGDAIGLAPSVVTATDLKQPLVFHRAEVSAIILGKAPAWQCLTPFPHP